MLFVKWGMHVSEYPGVRSQDLRHLGKQVRAIECRRPPWSPVSVDVSTMRERAMVRNDDCWCLIIRIKRRQFVEQDGLLTGVFSHDIVW